MRLLHVENWLRAPSDRDVIKRWTPEISDSADNLGDRYRIEFPADAVPEGNEPWEFLALGDTGDADAAGPHEAPQDAVAIEMTRDAVAPVGNGAGRLVIHTGDVIYMTGERRLYERNFRRPYVSLLAAHSTVDNLVFRIPFLPVPGNHDYYDLGGWANWLSKVPLLGSGLRAVAHEIFSFGLPEGGSDMGAAYMNAFVQPVAERSQNPNRPLLYTPSSQTRVPNRYYQCTVGNVDFFALDSNTLDAPPPSDADAATIHADANARLAALQARAVELEAELKQQGTQRTEREKSDRDTLAADPNAKSTLLPVVQALVIAIDALSASLPPSFIGTATLKTRMARDTWHHASDLLVNAADSPRIATALTALDAASDNVCAALTESQTLLADLPRTNAAHAKVLASSAAVETALAAWTNTVHPHAGDEIARALSEEALDVQREIALEGRRQRFENSDHDAAQLAWLAAALETAEKARPDNWRIVFLHHPLYTTITNHCERPDVIGLRSNLLQLLKPAGRVHLVLAGHAHAFEWIRASALPNTGLFVTGGGGQITLRSSIFAPHRIRRHTDRYNALRVSGVEECAVAGRGPDAADGEDRSLYHYLKVRVLKDSLEVHPVGVRELSSGKFRRETPMPVYHVPVLPAESAERRAPTRRMSHIEIRRESPPKPVWEETR